MGVIQPDFWLYDYYVKNYAVKNNKQLNEISMLELGNQTFQDSCLISQLNLPKTVKEYWESKGVMHTSIDLNGKDGAVPLDLSKPLPANFFNAFNIVTNCGTSEHVDNQYECWKNIHKSLKVNGFLLCANPEKDKYNEKHCNWFYDIKFFEAFACRLGYTIYHLGSLLFPFNGGYVIFAAMEKTKDGEFVFSEDEFTSLIHSVKNSAVVGVPKSLNA
ncbi:MAG TPA: hypothetical protein PK536_11825 [Ignavibacteria bacterium]|nr:hypothetical protein [Bacteroidota bacterium]HRI86123.1 hypothetical protein [Ignavibacteria bacterium]HRK00447.1 hypothetical protein [Ignavibacteria bacterium]